MVILLSVILGLFLVAAARVASTRIRSVLLVLATTLLVIGGLCVVVLFAGARNLWVEYPWMPNAYLLGSVGVLGVTLGLSVLIGLGARGALGRLGANDRPR